MDKISIKEISDFIGGALTGEDTYIDAVTTDSREAKSGTLFIGIKGERADGNDFAADFLNNGGSCAVVEKNIAVPKRKAVIRVSDTKKAIRDIAEFYRTKLNTDVVAVTGSVGKTSTKDMLNSVLSKGFATYATKGNFNNEIGVPLTIFQIDSSHSKAVVEMGMSNLGEISRLTKIAKPDVAVITNIGTSHIGNLGSQENILKAKLEILECLNDNGIVILNGDDSYLWGCRNTISHKAIYYGIKNKHADYVVTDIKTYEKGSNFNLEIEGEIYSFNVPIIGLHHIYNAVCSIICGLYFGMSVEKISEGVKSFVPSGMRQREIDVNGVKIVEDCYNASTDSMQSSLNVLSAFNKSKRRIAVLADMLEQGGFAEQNHRLVGKYVAAGKADVLICVGEDARYIALEAEKQGFTNEIYYFKNNSTALAAVCDLVKDGDVILLKGSRGMKLEEISVGLQDYLKG